MTAVPSPELKKIKKEREAQDFPFSTPCHFNANDVLSTRGV